MHYWNRDNFEGLLDLADAFESNSLDFDLLSRYCRYRENGRRKEAFEALREFLNNNKPWIDSVAREKCQTILELQSLVPGVHQFLSQPLMTQFIDPVLEKWLMDEPENPQPLRWFGLLHGHSEYLCKALTITPEDNPVRSRLITMHMADVDYATHHLDEGHFIGNLEMAKQALKTAEQLLNDAPKDFPSTHLKEEITTYESMLNDWEEFSESPEGTFPAWCAAKNRYYFWPTKFYYKDV